MLSHSMEHLHRLPILLMVKPNRNILRMVLPVHTRLRMILMPKLNPPMDSLLHQRDMDSLLCHNIIKLHRSLEADLALCVVIGPAGIVNWAPIVTSSTQATLALVSQAGRDVSAK